MADDNTDDRHMVLLERSDHIATVTLNRPQSRNAFNSAMRGRFLQVLQDIQKMQDLRVIIINGAGRGFCAGADLKEPVPDDVRMQLMGEYAPLLLALRRMNVVVIAAVHGAAAGIGAAIVASADLAIMTTDATVQLSFSGIALVPDGGLTWELVRALGYKRAYRLMIEGGQLNATQCQEFGLVNEVVPAARLMDEAQALAERIAQLSPLCNGLTKRAAREAQRCSYEEAMEYEAGLQQIAAHSVDFREGVEAFLAKRPPVFSGR